MSEPSFVEMARTEIVSVQQYWQQVKANHGGYPGDQQLIIEKLLGNQIMLLRAIEEVEARPWWRPRRRNPYAR